jgi:hypothetical protein
VSESDEGAPDGPESSDALESSALREIATWIGDFDWLHIPGAVRAISKLVMGVADAGAAWIDIAKAAGEARAQQKRDLKKPRSAAMDAMAKAAIQKGAQNPQLVDRAVERFFAELYPKQSARESVAKETLKLLATDPPKPGTPPPDDYWLNMFTSFAEQATTERMQKRWADVLAREIRKPGSFSRVALHILSLMDTQLAQQIVTIKTWVMQDDNIPFTHSLHIGARYTTLLSLEAVGIV